MVSKGILTATLCLSFLLAAASSNAQDAPFLSHGTVFEEKVAITLHGNPGDHFVLYWGVTKGSTEFSLPLHLGGTVKLEIAPAWPFTSSFDGGIIINPKGYWSFNLPSLSLIRTLVPRLYFQVVSFRVTGSKISSTVSNCLEVDISEPTNPKSKFQNALQILKKQQEQLKNGKPLTTESGTPLRSRRITTHYGAYRYDPFGNRIYRPRIILR